ncbi:hypothetical protein Tco_0855091 [Tanacetum coccineum]
MTYPSQHSVALERNLSHLSRRLNMQSTVSSLLDHLKMALEWRIHSSSNVKLYRNAQTELHCYEVMKDLIKVSKLPQTSDSIFFLSSATRWHKF